jgi:Fe-S oxidoreductase
MKIFGKLIGGNVLYYPGCMTKFVLKDLGENYRKILRKIGIDFIELKDLEVCCGSPVLNAGYFQQFELLVKANIKTFKEHAIKKVITSCPACFKTFKIEYPKFVKVDFEVEHTTQTIWKAIVEKKLKLKKLEKLKVTFHDPCHLGRYCGIYEEPRKILESLGFEVVEMNFSRENSWCCGGGGGLISNYPELAETISFDRINQAKETEAEALVTACPLCYSSFKRVLEKANLKLKLYEISELVQKAL